MKGRVALLNHKKALVISTTHFSEKDYKAAWEGPMARLIDDWGLWYPGVKKVEHAYFYRLSVADGELRQSYLEQAYKLGLEYSSS